MKTKKIMIVSLLLLAILTIGAVSASEDVDTLAIEDGGELSVDASSADVVANAESPEISPEEINIDTHPDQEFITDESDENYMSEENQITVTTPNDANGTIIISSNGQEFFSKELKDFDDNNSASDDFNTNYMIRPHDVNFFEGLENNDLVSISFLMGTNLVKTEYYKFITDNGDTFRLSWPEDANTWIFGDEGEGTLYSDYTKDVVSIWLGNDETNGIFYVSANGKEYKFAPYYDENGQSWHSWALSSFNITEPGIYPVTFKNGKDKDHLTVIRQGYLNVTAFNYDAFRVIEDMESRTIRIYCPENTEGVIVSIFVKNDWDDEYLDEAYVTYEITPENYNEWITCTFDELGMSNEDDRVVFVNIMNGTDEILNTGDLGIWYDENYRLIVPSDLMILINRGEYREENGEDTVIELWIPETSMIYEGTLEVTSDVGPAYSREFSVYELDFDDRGRYYCTQIAFQDLDLEGLLDGAILTVAFTDEASPKNVTKSFFYNERHDEDEGDSIVLDLVNFCDVNFFFDGNLILISDFPDGVDDEFAIFIDRWGDIVINTTWKISELTKNEDGLYAFNITALNYHTLMDDMTDADFDMGIVFYIGGEEADEFYGNPRVYKNPDILSGEVAIDNEEEAVIIFGSLDNFYLDELQSLFNDEFNIVISHNGNKTTIPLRLSKMEDYLDSWEDEETGEKGGEYRLGLGDLGIDEYGIYDISLQFVKDEEIAYFNFTITVVDFVIYTRNPNTIDDVIFRIMLPEDANGSVVIKVNGTPVFENTLSFIGFSDWNRMGGFNIPLNYLQIAESGNYDLELEVYDADGNKFRNITHNVGIEVRDNVIGYRNLVYGYGEGNFIEYDLTKPIPIDSVLTLYLNGKKAGSTKIGDHEFGFDVAASFKDAVGNLKPGHYDAVVKFANGTVFAESQGSFDVLAKNGDVNVSVPTAITTLNELSVAFYTPNLPDEDHWDNVRFKIYLDPEYDDFGICDDPFIEICGGELQDFWTGKVYSVNLGPLSEGKHNVVVQYFENDDWDNAINYEFYSNLFIVNVQKAVTKITAAPVVATYGATKYLIVTLKDANGNALHGGWVTIIVGKLQKTAKTNKKGQVVLDVSSLTPSNTPYKAAFKFAGSKYYAASSNRVKVAVVKAKPIFIAPKVKVKVNVKTKKVSVALKANGKVLAYKQISLKVKGVTYTASTGKKGIALFKVKNLKKNGKYTGNLYFAGDKFFKASKGAVTIFVKK